MFQETSTCEKADWQQYFERRRNVTHGKVRFAIACHVGAITFTAVLPGLIPNLGLLGFAASAAVVAIGLSRSWLNQLTAPLLQGIFSVTFLVLAGSIHPGVIYMLVSHAIIAMVVGVWIDNLHEA